MRSPRVSGVKILLARALSWEPRAQLKRGSTRTDSYLELLNEHDVRAALTDGLNG